MNPSIILTHLTTSILIAFRYGILALCISGAFGIGCRQWPLIKPKAAEIVEGINNAVRGAAEPRTLNGLVGTLN